MSSIWFTIPLATAQYLALHIFKIFVIKSNVLYLAPSLPSSSGARQAKAVFRLLFDISKDSKNWSWLIFPDDKSCHYVGNLWDLRLNQTKYFRLQLYDSKCKQYK